MNKEETRAKIQEVLTQGLFLNEDSKFDFESTFGEDLGLDSLDKIEVKLTIEDALDIMPGETYRQPHKISKCTTSVQILPLAFPCTLAMTAR